MKNLLKLTLGLLISTLIFTSCGKDESIDKLENQTLTFDSFFKRVSSMDLDSKSENVFYIDYKWDKKNNLITIGKIIEKEPEFFILEPSQDLFKTKKKYTVDCDLGDDSWSEECDGKFSCGSLIYDCLEAGGCAEICNQKMAYAPQNKTFYLISNE